MTASEGNHEDIGTFIGDLHSHMHGKSQIISDVLDIH